MNLLTKKIRKPSSYPARFERAGSGFNQAGRIFPQHTPRVENQVLTKNLVDGTFLRDLNSDSVAGDFMPTKMESASFENGVQSFKANDQFGGISKTGALNIVDHIYYARAYVKAPPGYNTIRFQVYSVSYGSAVVPITGTGDFQFASLTHKITGGTASLMIQDNAVTPSESFQITKAILIDLTAAFGVGKEPSKEECDIKFAEANGGPLVQPANPVWIEENTTNLIQSPLDLNAPAWAIEPYRPVCTGGYLDPFGSNRAWLIQDTKTNENSHLRQSVTIPNDSLPRTFSSFVKRHDVDVCGISVILLGGSTSVQAYARLNLTTGVIGEGDGMSVAEAGDGWYKVSCTLVNNGTGNITFMPRIFPAPDGGTGSVYVSMPQVEQKGYATNFVEGTRSTELYTLPTPAGLTPIQGSIRMWTYINSASKRQITSNWTKLLYIPRTSGGNGILIQHSASAANWQLQTFNDANTASSIAILDTVTPNGWHHFAAKWSATELKFYIDGVVVGTLANPNLPTGFANTIMLGCSSVGQPAYAWGSMIDEVHITNDSPTDSQMLDEYLTYPAVPYAATVALIRPRMRTVEQGIF